MTPLISPSKSYLVVFDERRGIAEAFQKNLSILSIQKSEGRLRILLETPSLRRAVLAAREYNRTGKI